MIARNHQIPTNTPQTKGLSTLDIALIIVFGWLGLFLIIGLIESYIAFSRLARGRHARRGLPIAFAGMFPFLSCFFLCCHQRGFQAKTAEEQVELTAAWKKTNFFTKIGRWLVWGFRYKYPTFLGTAPLRRRKWQDKDVAVVPTAPVGPLPPPGSMYVVGNPADVAQRGSVYPPAPGAPQAGWYAPQPVDANGNPIPVQYPYGYAPQGVPAQGAPGAVPGAVPPGIPPSLQPGQQGSPQLPTRPVEAHLSPEQENRSLPTGSPVSPASGLAGGSPVMAGGVPVLPVVAGHEVAGGDGVVHEAPAGEVRSNAEVVEGKGKAPAIGSAV